MHVPLCLRDQRPVCLSMVRRGQRARCVRAGGRLTAGGRRADDRLVGLGLFAREWERTCSECGYTCRVPRSIARRGIRGMSAMTVPGGRLRVPCTTPVTSAA